MLLILTTHGCNSGKESKNASVNEKVSDECMVYPHVVDSLNLQDLYDSARIALFTWHCDMPYRPKDDSLKNMTFGQLELKFDRLITKSDTIEFTFNFYDGDKIVIATGLRDVITVNTGVGYDRKTRKKIYMSSPDGFVIYQKGGNNRFENPFQPEVLTYIKTNWNKLDRCFKELAIPKGINK
jgi:hypothetical protein